jgi:hypothetical protein
MEYDRWDVETALREMYAFDFGHPIPIQEHNLRTYLPRPLPDEAQWRELASAFAQFFEEVGDYAALVRRMRAARGNADLEKAIDRYLRDARPFALGLAHRLIDTPADPLAPPVCRHAIKSLGQSDVEEAGSIAAALIADFGDAEQQQALLNLLESEPRDRAPSLRYQAAVRGVTNRYTPNRIAFLKPLLADERLRVEAEAAQDVEGRRETYRYCDTAVARLCTILDLYPVYGPSLWEQSRQQFIAWFREHPQAAQPVRLGQSAVALDHMPHAAVEDRDDYRR